MNIFNYISRYIIGCIFNILISRGIVQYVLFNDASTIESYNRFFEIYDYCLWFCNNSIGDIKYSWKFIFVVFQ